MKHTWPVRARFANWCSEPASTGTGLQAAERADARNAKNKKYTEMRDIIVAQLYVDEPRRQSRVGYRE
jgi:hypothetical protein